MSEKTSLTTELKTPSETLVFQQNNLASWCRVTSSIRHSPEAGLNALVDCSAAAFGHIHLMTQSPLSNEAKKNIVEHLETLQQHYQQLGYSQDISLAAHYAVCATLDDILRCMGSDVQFLQNFHDSRLEQEKLYSILEHISPQAEKYIDLLELIYLCLRFGYKGQYRSTPFGLQQWSLLTDKTYRLITQIRGQHSHILSPSLPPPSFTPKKAVAKKHRRFYLLALLVFIVLTIATSLIFQQTYNTTREALGSHATTTPQQQEVAT